jgi:hypothetical protein
LSLPRIGGLQMTTLASNCEYPVSIINAHHTNNNVKPHQISISQEENEMFRVDIMR